MPKPPTISVPDPVWCPCPGHGLGLAAVVVPRAGRDKDPVPVIGMRAAPAKPSSAHHSLSLGGRGSDTLHFNPHADGHFWAIGPWPK